METFSLPQFKETNLKSGKKYKNYWQAEYHHIINLLNLPTTFKSAWVTMGKKLIVFVGLSPVVHKEIIDAIFS